jgi:hypothetical protein
VGASIGAFSVKQIAASNAKTAAMATAQANATQTAIAANYPFSDKLVLNDPLHDNSKGNSWENNANCNFTDKGYIASDSQQNTYQSCLAAGTANFRNFTYEVEMTITKGDCGGLIFRSDDALTRFYYFRVCQGGYYDLSSIGKDAASSQTLINYSPSGFPVNLQQTTQIAVKANASWNRNECRLFTGKNRRYSRRDHQSNYGSLYQRARLVIVGPGNV